MVDFNNETTVAQPFTQVMGISTMERLEHCVEALESFHISEEYHNENSNKRIIVKARLLAVWYKLQAMIKRRKPKEYEAYKDKVYLAEEPEELIEVFELLNELVDEVGVNRLDNKKSYHGLSFEEANALDGI